MTRLFRPQVGRLESFDEDLTQMATVLGVRGGLPSHLRANRRNANHIGAVDVYTAALRKSARTICVICAILSGDYACLGYQRPPECTACKMKHAVATSTTPSQLDSQRSLRTECPGEPTSCRFVPTALPRQTWRSTLYTRVNGITVRARTNCILYAS